MIKISISPGNRKMGAVPSVSLPPVTTCAAGCACAKKCYAAKMCRIWPSVRAAYDRNLAAWLEDPAGFETQVRAAACCTRFFRWHVSGDVVSPAYMSMIIRIAQDMPGTHFLVFSKRYGIVNTCASKFDIPDNLHIIFSAWPGMAMDNPHNFPVAHVIFRGKEPRENWKICGGNCAECACQGVGCWQLKRGEHIAFYEH